MRSRRRDHPRLPGRAPCKGLRSHHLRARGGGPGRRGPAHCANAPPGSRSNWRPHRTVPRASQRLPRLRGQRLSRRGRDDARRDAPIPSTSSSYARGTGCARAIPSCRRATSSSANRSTASSSSPATAGNCAFSLSCRRLREPRALIRSAALRHFAASLEAPARAMREASQDDSRGIVLLCMSFTASITLAVESVWMWVPWLLVGPPPSPEPYFTLAVARSKRRRKSTATRTRARTEAHPGSIGRGSPGARRRVGYCPG